MRYLCIDAEMCLGWSAPGYWTEIGSITYRAELALTKAKLFDRAVIKLDSRALSYGGAVYKVPSRHHGALPSLAALLISNVLFESWLQGHSAILGQRMYTAGNRTSWARNGRYDMLSKRHICFGA